MKNNQLVWTSISIAVIVAGCCSSAIKSTRINPAEVQCKQSKPQPSGIPYFLPTGRVRLVAVRDEPPVAVPNADPAWAELVSTRRVSSTNSTTQNGIVDTNHWSFSVIHSNVLNLLTTPRYTYTVTIEPVIRPDPAQMYILSVDESLFADDEYHIKVENGLISTIASTNADKTSNIVMTLVQTGIEVYKLASGGIFPPGGGPKSATESQTDAAPDFPKRIEVEFDPADDEDLQTAANSLSRALLRLTVDKTDYTAANSSTPVSVNQTANGIFFRSPLPYTVRIESLAIRRNEEAQAAFEKTVMASLDRHRDREHKRLTHGLSGATRTARQATAEYMQATNSLEIIIGELKDEVTFRDTRPLAGGDSVSLLTKGLLLPGRGPILSYDITRAAMVTKGTYLVFGNGTLTEVHSSKPSELNAGLGIPLAVARSLVSLPTEMIQLRINLNNSNTALVNSQQSQLLALSNLLETERLLAVMRTNHPPGTNPPAK